MTGGFITLALLGRGWAAWAVVSFRRLYRGSITPWRRPKPAPTLVIHGDSDAIVPFEVSGRRTAEAIDGSKLVLVPDAPHGLNVTHAQTFNAEVLAFLRG